VLQALKAGFAHHPGKFILAREFDNRVRQVLVSAALGNKATDGWQNLLEIKVVNFSEQLTARVGKFEDHRSSSRFKDPKHFVEPFLTINHISDTESDSNSVESCVRMWNLLARSVDQHNPLAILRFVQLGLTVNQHPLGEIFTDDGHRRIGLLGNLQSDVTGTGSNIQNPAIFR